MTGGCKLALWLAKVWMVSTLGGCWGCWYIATCMTRERKNGFIYPHSLKVEKIIDQWKKERKLFV